MSKLFQISKHVLLSLISRNSNLVWFIHTEFICIISLCTLILWQSTNSFYPIYITEYFFYYNFFIYRISRPSMISQWKNPWKATNSFEESFQATFTQGCNWQVDNCPPRFCLNRRTVGQRWSAALLLAHPVLGSQLRPCKRFPYEL